MADCDLPGDERDDTMGQHRTARTSAVWHALRAVVEGRAAATGRHALDVIDVGGGTGGFAVPIAELGHRVIVVDSSADALAALARRVSDAGVSDLVRDAQADASDLVELLGPDSADVVLCHGVLEYVDDPPAVLSAVAGCLRPGGTASVLVANRFAAVLGRALTGRFDEARTALSDPDGRFGQHDPLPRRFTPDEIVALIVTAGLSVGEIHGVRIFADLVSGGLADAEPGARDALADLETAAATEPAFYTVAAQLHLVAARH